MPTFRSALPNCGSSGGCCSPTRRLRAALALGQGASAPLLYIVSNFCFSRRTVLRGITSPIKKPGSPIPRARNCVCQVLFFLHLREELHSAITLDRREAKITSAQSLAFRLLMDKTVQYGLSHLPALSYPEKIVSNGKNLSMVAARKKPEFPRASQPRHVGILDLHTVEGPTSRAPRPGELDYSGVSLALHDQLVPNIGCRSGCRVRWLPQR